jgi:hypothetical protein
MKRYLGHSQQSKMSSLLTTLTNSTAAIDIRQCYEMSDEKILSTLRRTKFHTDDEVWEEQKEEYLAAKRGIFNKRMAVLKKIEQHLKRTDDEILSELNRTDFHTNEEVWEEQKEEYLELQKRNMENMVRVFIGN